LGSAGAALAALAGPVAIVVAALTAAGAAIYAIWTHASTYIMEIFEPIADDIMAIGANLWEFFGGVWAFLEPIFAVLGAVLVSVFGVALRVITSMIRGVTDNLALFGRLLRWVGETIGPPLFEAAQGIVAFGRDVANFLAGPLRWLSRGIIQLVELIPGVEPGQATIATTEPGEGEGEGGAQGLLDRLMEAFSGTGGTGGPTFETIGRERTGQAPGGRPTQNIDMRGSTINVRQEFREADPDRIWLQFAEGMAREAMIRTQTGFVPALSR